MSKPLGILRHHFLAQIVTDVVFLFFLFPIVETQRFGKDVKSHKAIAHHSIKDVICVCLFVRQQGK